MWFFARQHWKCCQWQQSMTLTDLAANGDDQVLRHLAETVLALFHGGADFTVLCTLTGQWIILLLPIKQLSNNNTKNKTKLATPDAKKTNITQKLKYFYHSIPTIFIFFSLTVHNSRWKSPNLSPHATRVYKHSRLAAISTLLFMSSLLFMGNVWSQNIFSIV